MKMVVLRGAELGFESPVDLCQFLDLKPCIRRCVHGVVDGRAVVCITFELRSQRKQIEGLILILFRGIARCEQLHDFGHPLAVKLGILGGLSGRTQVLLELDREARIIPKGKESVRLHVDDVFLGL
jgi:hypothetical protein